MSKFRKKPVVIEAFQVGSSRFYPEWLHEAVSAGVVVTHAREGSDGWKEPFDHADIQTPEGVMRADRGDWIIRGVEGELYPCKDSIFRQTYESAEDGEPPAQDPTINVVFRCEDDGVVGTTSHQPIHSVRQEDDGSFTVALDYWPTPTRQPDPAPSSTLPVVPEPPASMLTQRKLTRAINALGIDSRAGTPDYVLADAIWAYLHGTPAKSLPAQPRRPYGTDTMSEYGVIPECDGPKPPAQEPMTDEQVAEMHHLDQFGLFCDLDEFGQIVRAVEQFHGIGKGESNEG